MQQRNDATMQQCNNATMQQRNDATTQRCNNATMQQTNESTMKLGRGIHLKSQRTGRIVNAIRNDLKAFDHQVAENRRAIVLTIHV